MISDQTNDSSYYQNPYNFMKNIKIRLNSGRMVNVRSLMLSHTYGDVLEGRKDSETHNRSIFERLECPKMWGERKTLKLSPTKEEFEKGLKPFVFIAWLDSNQIDSAYDGSELVVIWTADMRENATLKEIIFDGIKDINWEGNARDYYF